MRSNLQQKIYVFIKKNAGSRPEDLRRELGVSLVSIHKHLKALLEAGRILRHGKPPLVFYGLTPLAKGPAKMETELEGPGREFIENRYVYISPTGTILEGVAGFWEWVKATQQEKQFVPLASEFFKIRKEADHFFQSGEDRIDATEKLRNTFPKIHLDRVFYQDFYSLPKFGKTRLGAFVLHAKQSQNLGLIKKVSQQCEPVLNSIIKANNIDSIAFIPHSIPRRIPFLKELEKNLKLPLKKIEIVKAYSGEIPVAQKSLSKLEERIANARNTFFLKNLPSRTERVLMIDDAVGSGATMNEVAKIIQDAARPKSLMGFAIVGSYKGFEVIREA